METKLLETIKNAPHRGHVDKEGVQRDPETLGSILKRSGVNFTVEVNPTGGDQLRNTINWFKIKTNAWELRLPGSGAYKNGYYTARVTYADGETERFKIYAHSNFYDPYELWELEENISK